MYLMILIGGSVVVDLRLFSLQIKRDGVDQLALVELVATKKLRTSDMILITKYNSRRLKIRTGDSDLLNKKIWLLRGEKNQRSNDVKRTL
jgi:hypothetical protein